MKMKKLKLMAVTMTGALALMACSADVDNEGEGNEGEDTAQESQVSFGSDLATIKGNDYGSEQVLNNLVEDGVVPSDVIIQGVLDEVLDTYYSVSDEEVDDKIAQIKSFEKASGNEIEDDYLEQNREYVEETVQMEKALSDVVEVTDEQKDEMYEQMKVKYDVVDILVFSEEGKEKGEEILEEVKGADEEELQEIVDKYADNQEIHVDIMSYAKNEIPVEDTSKLDDFEESGDTIVSEGDTAYNVIYLQDKTELEREDIESRLNEAVLYESVGSTGDILKLMEEHHSDFTLSDEVTELIEQEGQPQQPQGQTGVEVEEGTQELIEDAVEEEEGSEE